MARSDSSFLMDLLAHPNTPSAAVRRVAARAERVHPDSLRFGYLLEADPERVRIPAPVGQGGRADRLWARTCFEAFVARDRSSQYLELNFSPSGQWAAYRFDSYRQGMMPALAAAPQLVLRQSADRLELQAEVHLGGLLSSPVPGRLSIALSAVVEDREGRLSYWALRHPPGRPDFHHPESFSLVLDSPAGRNP